MSNPISRQIFISGRVQGVFYRDNTQQQAQKLGITGWVRNIPDGRVEALLSGEEHAVQQLLTWCKRGSPAADVSNIDIIDVPYEAHEQFIVRYDTD